MAKPSTRMPSGAPTTPNLTRVGWVCCTLRFSSLFQGVSSLGALDFHSFKKRTLLNYNAQFDPECKSLAFLINIDAFISGSSFCTLAYQVFACFASNLHVLSLREKELPLNDFHCQEENFIWSVIVKVRHNTEARNLLAPGFKGDLDFYSWTI